MTSHSPPDADPRSSVLAQFPRLSRELSRELALDALALLWPTACVGCGVRDRELCTPCRLAIEDAGRASPPRSIEGLAVPGFAAAAYEGPVRGALLAYKHRGAFGFVRPLGRRLAQALGLAVDLAAAHVAAAHAAAAQTAATQPVAGRTAGPVPVPLVVPVPSRRKRVRERGFRHVDELVRVALRRGRLPLELCGALRARPGRTGQVGLDSAARERNARRVTVKRSFARRLSGRQVILVDDIVTTGASLRAAIAVVEGAGARVVAVVALCLTARRDAPQKTEWNLTGERG